MTLNRLIRTFALASLLFGITSGSFAGEIYFKCTRADNTVIYLETKPAATACATIEEVKVSTNRGTPGAHQGNTESNNEAAQKGVQDRDLADRKAKAKEACTVRKSNLEVLKASSAITVKDENGNSKALSPEEIQARIAETERYIRDFCSE